MTQRSMPRFVKTNAFILGLLLGALGTGQAAQAATPKTAGIKNQWATQTVTLSLLQAVEQAQAKGNSFTQVTDKFLPTDPQTQQLQLELIFQDGADLSADDLSLNNCEVKSISNTYGRASVWVSDPSAVLELAKVPGVRTVRPNYGHETRAGNAMSEAPRAMMALEGIEKYKIDGRNIDGRTIKFGVLSDSFANTGGVRKFVSDAQGPATTPPLYQPGILENALNQTSGDLPPQVEIIEEYIGGGTDEGAGMAELIYDMAPASNIAFHTVFNGLEADFAEAIRRLWQEANCNIVVDDVIFYAEAMFQQGPVAQAARRCVEAGNPYYSSAGNNANYGYRFTFNDANPKIDEEDGTRDGNDFHRWENGEIFLPITILGGDVLIGITQWNQPFDSISEGNGSQIDLDVYFYDVPTTTTGSIVFSSIDIQGNTGAPRGDALENINVINGSFEPVTYYMAINHNKGMQDRIPQSESTPLEISCVFFAGMQRIGGISNTTSEYGGPTIYGHSIAPGVVSVAAVPWYDTLPYDRTFPPSNDIDPEYFSSRGGDLTLYFDDNGNFAPSTEFQPDISGVDGNNTTFFGMPLDLNGFNGEPDQFPNFFGTSASAPNAAAIAGLLLDMDPSLTPAEIEQILADTATDVIGRRADFGVDDVTGPGLINAEAAMDVVAARLGINPIETPFPTPAPMERQTFSFDVDDEGWVPVSDETFFTKPYFEHASDSLTITTTDNAKNFGFWASPHVVVGGWERPEDIPLEGDPDNDDIYRVIYTVGSDVAESNANQVPVIRLRQNSSNFAQSNLVVITSQNDPIISPTDSSDQNYRVYFELPEGENRFRLNFDVLNAGYLDNVKDATFYLRRVVVDSIDKSDLTDQQFEKESIFTDSNDNGWKVVPRSGNPSAPEIPESGVDREGLRFGPATLGDDVSYVGYWVSPDNFQDPAVADSAVKLRKDRLYEATFTVSSNATNAEEAANLPNFRLRVNDQSQNFSALVAIESIDSNTALPLAGAPREYKMYFEGREDLDQNNLIFAFDYILPLVYEAPGYTPNDPTKTITLESFSVTSYNLPY